MQEYNPLLGDEIQEITDPKLLFFDATVGVNADYPTYALAYASGKRKFKQISHVTETESPAIAENCYIEGNGFILTCNYQFSKNINANLIINNLEIITTYAGVWAIEFIRSGILTLNNVILNYSENNDDIFIKVREFYADRCKFILPTNTTRIYIYTKGKVLIILCFYNKSSPSFY